MSQIILIEPNPNLREILTLNLQTYVGATIIIRESAEDAIELLNILPEIDLIITKNIIKDEQTAKKLLDFLSQSESSAAVIVLGTFDHQLKSKFLNIKDHLNWEEVIKATAKILSIDDQFLNNKIHPDFLPIPITYFLPIETTACDVFIRIKKAVDDFQYVKRIHSGDVFSKDMVHKYQEQGLEYFYIPKDQQQQFTVHISNQLVQKLEDINLNSDAHLIVLAESFSLAVNEVKNLGFNSATVQLTEAIINNMLKTAEMTPELSVMLKKIVNSQTNYLYQHAHMTSLIAGEIVKFLNVNNSHHVRVVAYAALFKDITLANRPDLAKISNFAELEEAELEDEDWDLVFNHAYNSSLLILKNPGAPEGLAEVLKTHHGSHNGKGFSITNVNKLPTLQQIFVVSCEFVREILLYKENGGSAKPVIKTLYEKFSGEEVILIIKTLEKVLLNLKRKKI